MARVLAVGSPREVDSHPLSSKAKRIDRPSAVLIPGLVNAHTHLDLTHMGPMEHDPEDGFVAWVDRIRARRLTDPGEIAASVRLGIERSLAGGTVAVGDIAGAVDGAMTTVPFEILAASGMLGVSFAEFFGIGSSESGSIEQIDRFVEEHIRVAQGCSMAEREDPQQGGVRLGLQPHAPCTVGPSVYQRVVRLAAEAGMPVSTHLAETPEERSFIVEGTGPQRVFLERLGLWNEAILEWAGRSPSPVAHLASVLGAGPMLVAHVNDASDSDIQTLASTGTSVAYCPRASAYFGAERHFGPHRYRDMLDAGVNVSLGTDSIVNLPPEQAVARMSILDEMRLLHQRDGMDPVTLLQMATINGASALGLDPAWFAFQAEEYLAGLVAVDVEAAEGDSLARVLSADTAPELLFASSP